MRNQINASVTLDEALQPQRPHTSIEYMPGDTDITIVVHSDDFERELFRSECTFSFAAQYLTQGDRFIWDETEIGQGEFIVLHAQGPVPARTHTPAPPTMSLSEAVSELINRAGKGCTICIEGVNWTVA